MATFSSTPGSSYVNVNTNSAPVFVELFEPGILRVHVGPIDPGSSNGTYHLISYPDGMFSYGGNEKVWVRNDADTGTVKVIATEVI